ncbi:vacuolar protein-sorting-associated protein 25 [Fopius arisanus]|uniref:Vacuolar protein-sorting-associated protein 25 n=1 Tax=Fopius arisanus TaxID=64838 RepID=A0A0C9QFY4_9HYME|nr:PREDICTED: vacuolar protein-sorting-associated protein 25 [Fopius arisanus]
MAEIEWPWQYNFPPFFTLQPHSETQQKQLMTWTSLVLDYYRATKQSVLDIREMYATPLFNNTEIKRKLSIEVVQLILDSLLKSGKASPLDKSKQRWLIYWHTLDEWGETIYNWAQMNGLIGSVCTLFELIQGDNTVDEEFFGLDTEVVTRALKTLESQGKAELMFFDDNQGVKFF